MNTGTQARAVGDPVIATGLRSATATKHFAGILLEMKNHRFAKDSDRHFLYYIL
jgi:hypothetical protein